MKTIQRSARSMFCEQAPIVGAFLLLLIGIVATPITVGGQTFDDKASLTTEPSTGHDQYKIGVGDVLDIRVYNRPQLSRDSIRVDGDGMIRMPLLEAPVRAACLSDTELGAEIAALYREYLRNPHVEVFIKDFQSRPVSVIGAVREPGRFQLQRKVRLLELLSLSGGPTEEAGGRIHVKHDLSFKSCEATNEVAVTNGASETPSESASTWYELTELLSSSSAEKANPIVRAGDIINVVEADKAYVVGNVFRPGTVSLKGRVTLTQALATAGGVLPNSNLDRIRVIRQTTGSASPTEIVADLTAIKKQRADDLVLQANDVVEVYSSRSKKLVSGLLNSVIPAATRLPIRVIN